jgi:hypothetical protein
MEHEVRPVGNCLRSVTLSGVATPSDTLLGVVDGLSYLSILVSSVWAST